MRNPIVFNGGNPINPKDGLYLRNIWPFIHENVDVENIYLVRLYTGPPEFYPHLSINHYYFNGPNAFRVARKYFEELKSPHRLVWVNYLEAIWKQYEKNR